MFGLRFASLIALVLAVGCGRMKELPALATSTASTDVAPVPPAPPSASAEPILPREEGVSEVDLAGVHHPRPPLGPGPKVGARAMLTDVYTKPDAQSVRLGFLRAGAIVALDAARGTKPVAGRGCEAGFLPIEPAGWVCSSEATTDLTDPIVRAAARRPDPAHKLPYMYGVVTRGGPAYAKIPTAEELAKTEPSLAKHLSKWRNDEVSGATYGLDVWTRYAKADGRLAPSALDALEQRTTDPAIPWFLAGGGRVPNLSKLVRSPDAVKIDEVSRRQGVAFLESFLFEGRRYNVSTDLRVIPADRFRPIRGSDFHGVEVGKEVQFPFALVRKKGAKKWKVGAKGKLESAGELEWRSAVQLTGKQKFFGGVLHYEAKEGFWVDDRSAGRIDPAKKFPGWAKKGERWIDINLTKQVLVAYEGEKAVFATLVSSGEAGLGDPETSRSTLRGIFRVHTKYASVTMDSDAAGEEYELRDVPYVQYFKDGYALHGAYWHDMFGQPKSHGCINLSPEDARRLFFWTDPQLPRGWHGVAKNLTGSVVFVHP
jgi:hypothetical protein